MKMGLFRTCIAISDVTWLKRINNPSKHEKYN
uniref:Uncharacterized protein n=1 Tax=Anguilla anguilla TaxID=7936 RepID=A0A0E9QHU5_ANGAN